MSTTVKKSAAATKQDLPLRVIFLGGVGEIGKNMTALEYGDEIIVIDCGVAFPSGDMPGIDLVIPDVTYLSANRDKVKAIVLTHGHEDHIGAIPYVLKELNVPVYGTRLTLALLEPKLREHKLVESARLNLVRTGANVNIGANFKVEFVNVSHSVAGSCALSITTPLGVVFHTGDFKVDFTPIAGNVIDLQRIAEIGQQGVMLLMSESTNVEKAGSSSSEAIVGRSLAQIFVENHDRRIIIATFASNVHRLQQIIDLAHRHGRKVAFSGRSMLNVSDVAFRIGELKFPPDTIVDIDKIKDIEDKHLVIITTGSQGEPMSALSRMSKDEFNHVRLDFNDTVVLSASPIPGNERMVYDVINNLYRHGTKVVYEKLADVHVSGHACQEELKLMINLLQPSYFIPVHGEFRHLKKHAELAMSMGIPAQRILLCDIGNCVEISRNRGMRLASEVTAGNILVDGLGVGDVGSTVLKDRIHLSEDGLFVVAIGINTENGEVTALEMQSRGFVYIKDSDNAETLGGAKAIIYKTLENFNLKGELNDWGILKNAIRRDLRSFLHKKTRRNPMIITMVLEN